MVFHAVRQCPPAAGIKAKRVLASENGRGKLADRLLQKIKDFFECNYTPEPYSGCWIWTGSTSQSGYGVIRAGSPIRAHRVAYELYVGEIPDGCMVLHSCDNRLCVNPAHLSIGSQLENMRDAYSRNRFKGKKYFLPDEIAKIKAESGTMREIAAKFGASPNTICNVRNNLGRFSVATTVEEFSPENETVPRVGAHTP